MKNTFAEDYRRNLEIEAAFDAAKAANDEAGMEAARAAHGALVDEVREKGSDYSYVLRLYVESMNAGNDCIDISEPLQNDAEMIGWLRNFGIEKFTFSSSWSSAVNTAWTFLQNGCKLEGMVEINSRNSHWNFKTGEEVRDKVPAYLFSL